MYICTILGWIFQISLLVLLVVGDKLSNKTGKGTEPKIGTDVFGKTMEWLQIGFNKIGTMPRRCLQQKFGFVANVGWIMGI